MRRPAIIPRPRRRPAAILISALTAAAPAPAAAADAPESPLAGQLRDQGAAVTALGGAHGLTGFLIEPPDGPPYTLYVTASGAGVVGQLYDPGGNSLSRRQLAAALADRSAPPSAPADGPPDAVAATAAADSAAAPVRPAAAARPGPSAGQTARADRPLVAASRAAGHVVRDGRPEIIVFADPDCRYSRNWLAALAIALPDGYGLRLIPVAVLGERSAQAAISIIAAPDPVAAWTRPPPQPPDRAGTPADAAGELAANNALLARWQARAVPFTLYPAAAGQWRGLTGAAADPARFIARLAAPTGD